MYRTALPIKPINTSNFYVVTVVSNPRRYRTRYDLYRKFAEHCAHSGAQLITVECSFGERVYEVTEAGNPWHVQLNTPHELWHKENMINLGIARLPRDWDYVAWIDADVHFMRPDWVQETVHQLQHYKLVQMYSQAIDMSPAMDPISVNYGFMYCYAHQYEKKEIPPLIVDNSLNPERMSNKGRCHPCYPYFAMRGDGKVFWHPGFAWAARRDAFDKLGGLLDTGILGAGDHHMSLALIGRAHEAMPPNVTDGYKRAVMDWQWRADKYIRRDIGYVPGSLYHYWHGKKADRKYWDRWKILTNNKFDPYVDLKRDAQGLWQLEDRGDDRSVLLRDQIRAYFGQRNEDSIDV